MVKAIALLLLITGVAEARTIRGVVYDDKNADGRLSAGEPGVRAVVAYGAEFFAATDDRGRYTLEVPDAAAIVWVRVPDGFVPGPVWTVADARPSLDLGLRRLAAPHRGPLTFVVASDTHLSPEQPFKLDLATVVASATALEPAPAFFTILGDITQGNQDADFDLVDRGLAGLEVPYIPVPGNHDWYDGGRAWFRRYGPDNYSFDIDRVHFVVWNMAMPLEQIELYLGAELARVDRALTIVALTHAPPTPPILAVLRRLGVDHVLSGHTHTNRVVDHDGLTELTTEPLLMGGLDFMPAGYRVITLDGGKLAAYHRTVVDEPQLAIVAPAAGGCAASGGAIVVAVEQDAAIPRVSARLDCGAPIALQHAGGWSWRGALPTLLPGPHTLTVTAGAATRTTTFVACREPAVDAPGAAWPQHAGDAAHTGATAAAVAPPLHQAWAAPAGGHVLQAAPVVGDGAVFVSATDLGRGDTGGVIALELATGAVRWRHATSVPVRGAPAIAGGIVAVAELDGTVLGLDTRTGAVRWRYELGARIEPGARPISAEAAAVFAAVTSDGGDFLVGNQRHLAVLDARGAPRWRLEPVPAGEYSQSLAAVAAGGGAVVGVFHRDLGGVIAWDRATGRERWRVESTTTESAVTTPLTIAINAAPVIAGDLVYLTNGLTEVFALELATGAVRWRAWLDDKGFDWGNAIIGTPAIAGGLLVVPTLYRDLVALDAATGAVRWRVAGAPGPLRATHYRGAGLAGFEASPVITKDIVWAADTSGRLGAYALATGARLWTTELGLPVLAGPAVASAGLVVATYDGSVRALVPGAPPPVPAARSCTAASSRGCCQATPPENGLLVAGLACWLARRRRAGVRGPIAGQRSAGTGPTISV